MLRQIADGVLIHESEFVQRNAVVVQGQAGVLPIEVAGQAAAQATAAAQDRDPGHIVGLAPPPGLTRALRDDRRLQPRSARCALAPRA